MFAMPRLPEELFLASIEALVRQDAAWVPDDPEKSLYLRPFMIGTEVGLGVRPASAYQYLLIASPAGAYFPGGVKPVSIWLSENRVRAVPGGDDAQRHRAAAVAVDARPPREGAASPPWPRALGWPGGSQFSSQHRCQMPDLYMTTRYKGRRLRDAPRGQHQPSPAHS